MKIKHLLISLSAVALFSCGGGTQNTNNEGAQSAQTADSQGEAESQPVDETVTLPEEVVKFINSLPKQPDKPFFKLGSNINYDGELDTDDRYFLYPIKSGGFVIIFEHNEHSEDGEDVWSYTPYIYKDGVAKTSREIMPVPDATLFVSEDNKDVQNEAFNKNLSDYVYYVISDSLPIIHAGLKLGEYKFFLPVYKWDGEKFAYYDMLAEFIKTLPKKADKPVYSLTDAYFILSQYCDNKIDYYALPHKNGGYTALVCYQAQCEATLFWDNFSYISKDGKITKVENILPVPDVNDLLDADKCKGLDNQVADIKKQYNSAPLDYLLYFITDSGELHATMEGNGCEQWGESDLDLMRDAVYTWNGEKFVLKPTMNIAKQVWYAWLEGDDPIGIAEPDQKPSDEIIAANRKRVKEHSATVAEFIAEGVEGFSETIACYKYTQGDKSGKWLVLKYLDGRGGGNTVTVYDYDGKEFNRLDNFFPKEFLRDVYLAEFDANGFLSYEDSDGNSDEILYKWNGEKFVK